MPSAMLLRSAITIHIQHDITPRVQVVGNCIWILPVGTLTDRASSESIREHLTMGSVFAKVKWLIANGSGKMEQLSINSCSILNETIFNETIFNCSRSKLDTTEMHPSITSNVK